MSDDDPITFIVEEVAKPVVRQAKQGSRKSVNGKGVDLSPHASALRYLLLRASEVYETALDDWQDRNRADKPKRRLEDNWTQEQDGPAYDYGEAAGEGFDQSWDEYWEETYGRDRGNPGRGRLRNVPVEPLYPVYWLVRQWWRETLGMAFQPRYPRAYEGDEGEEGDPRSDISLFSPAGRLLLLVAQEMNRRYTARNCYGLHETARKRLQRRKK